MNILNFESYEKNVEKGEAHLCANFKIFFPKNELFNIESLHSIDNERYNTKSIDIYEKESQEKIKDINISKIEFNINDLFKMDSINLPKFEDIKLKKKRGRKSKNPKIEKKEEHDKFSDDNIIKKCKHLVLKYALEFLNNQIKIIYNGNIGKGPFKKELQIINNSQKTNAHVEFNKNFLKKNYLKFFQKI